jgi:hypothetical protein
MKQAGRQSSPRTPAPNLGARIANRMREKTYTVWTAADFLDLGLRDAIDKALQRLEGANRIRRIDRGLYDMPRINKLTGQPTNPDYNGVIEAISRRDQIRVLVDGITAANNLGLTNAVPARVVVHTDARLKPIKLDNLTIQFKLTAPSRLYWAGRPAMRVVQALHWLHDLLPENREPILQRLRAILADGEQGLTIREDLRQGLHTLPWWMQEIVSDLLNSEHPVKTASAGKPVRRGSFVERKLR